jgi:hypothetical protein
MVGEVTTNHGVHRISWLLPELPFPGYCGLVRFYSTAAVARGVCIEEIAMKPKLPETRDGDFDQVFPFSVFLSHSSADKPTVLRVLAELKKAEISYWVDHEQIVFGDGIVSKIEEGLQKSKYVVVCLSENLGKSGWCRAEYGPILYREFSGDTTRRVIPLSLDGSNNGDSIPLLLSDKMRADFTRPDSFSSLMDFLKNGPHK